MLGEGATQGLTQVGIGRLIGTGYWIIVGRSERLPTEFSCLGIFTLVPNVVVISIELKDQTTCFAGRIDSGCQFISCHAEQDTGS